MTLALGLETSRFEVVFLIVFVGAILMVLSGSYAATQRIRAERYRSQTRGVVSSAELVGRPGGDSGGIMYSVDAKVTYEINTTHQVINWYPGSSTNYYREAAAEKYLGRVVTVSFAPEQTQDAIVGRPLQKFRRARLVYLVFCASVGAAVGSLL